VFKKLLPLFFPAYLFFVGFNCCAGTTGAAAPQHSLYAGGLGGFGSTTWNGLVPAKENQNMALVLSTPLQVREGGLVWGLFTGFEFSPYFAVEAGYTKYPEAKVYFDTMSLFSFNNNGLHVLNTQTETVNLMGKIMLVIPNSKIRVFSSAGIAEVHRKDFLIDQWLLSPTFGVGFNFRLSDHLMSEIGGNYTAGFGDSQLEPTSSYIPFLYSASIRLAYIF